MKDYLAQIPTCLEQSGILNETYSTHRLSFMVRTIYLVLSVDSEVANEAAH